MGRVEGRVAIVTGGAGGIGSAIGTVLCKEGASVLFVDADADALAGVADELRSAQADARFSTLVADVGEEASAARIVEAARAELGQIDTLVNCAGMRSYEPLAEARTETWNRILEVNLLSYAWLTQAAIGDLRASGRGSVINVSSTHAVNPRAGMGQYDVTKAGIVSMTKTLAFEEAKHGIRVNAVCPGLTFTPFHRKRAEAAGRTQADIDREAQGGCLMGRWADPMEMAYPVLWLASDEASYMTASVIMVDGGRFVL
ncbi:SDR family oxidoreductase [Arsenicitalea aurantiaca]|uniref:SDR family oxidoreductase n=1 Tax=Arsenicitalea aurantiaca TaxID=1783274 RepID=A0A433XKE6_9HYPH|nr:SDR family oxidoreductase [Arsenicitalea aurantiaca]RUT34550.1 SDR family oxidoreductase [Arsenicitalea aurantiaca]